jgi:hypothetical protein
MVLEKKVVLIWVVKRVPYILKVHIGYWVHYRMVSELLVTTLGLDGPKFKHI